MTTLFAASMIQHLKQSNEFDDLMEEKRRYPEEFSQFSTPEYLLLFYVVKEIHKGTPFFKMLKLLGTDFKMFLMSLYRESYKTIKQKDIKTYRYRWSDIEDDGSYDDLRSFIKEFCGDYIEFMPEQHQHYVRSYFPPIPPNTF
jgi:hypothetical protein